MRGVACLLVDTLDQVEISTVRLISPLPETSELVKKSNSRENRYDKRCERSNVYNVGAVNLYRVISESGRNHT